MPDARAGEAVARSGAVFHAVARRSLRDEEDDIRRRVALWRTMRRMKPGLHH